MSEEKIVERVMQDLKDGKVESFDLLKDLDYSLVSESLEALICEEILSEDSLRTVATGQWWVPLEILAQDDETPEYLLRLMAHNDTTGIYQYMVQLAIISRTDCPDDLYKELTRPGVIELFESIGKERLAIEVERLKSIAFDYADKSEVALIVLALQWLGVSEEANDLMVKSFPVFDKIQSRNIDEVSDLSEEDIEQLAANPLTSASLLLTIFRSASDSTISVLAKNPATPPLLLAYMWEMSFANNEGGMESISNPSVPAYMWKALKNDWKILDSLKDNDSELFQAMILAAGNWGLDPEFVDAIRSNGSTVLVNHLNARFA